MHQDIVRTVRCELQYRNADTNAANVFHVRYSSVFTDTEADALADIVKNWLDTDWKDNANDTWHAVGLVLTNMNSLAGIRKVYTFSPDYRGVLSGGQLPANVTVAIQGFTGTRGRGQSARWFWVGMDSSMIAGDNLGTGYGASIETALNALLDTIAGGPMFDGMVVPHLIVNKIPQQPANSTLITNWTLANYILDSQVDRLPGHKKHRKPRVTP